MKANDWFAVVAYIISTLIFVLFLKFSLAFSWPVILFIEILCLGYIALSVCTKWALEDASKAVNEALAKQIREEMVK
jgi:uncharacterized membrane protein